MGDHVLVSFHQLHLQLTYLNAHGPSICGSSSFMMFLAEYNSKERILKRTPQLRMRRFWSALAIDDSTNDGNKSKLEITEQFLKTLLSDEALFFLCEEVWQKWLHNLYTTKATFRNLREACFLPHPIPQEDGHYRPFESVDGIIIYWDSTVLLCRSDQQGGRCFHLLLMCNMLGTPISWFSVRSARCGDL